MKDLKNLKEQIVNSSAISRGFLSSLEQQLFEDGTITEKEAQFVYELSSVVVKKINSDELVEAWKDLYVKVITAFVLEDDRSKGEIDDIEAKWLADKIRFDKITVDIEKSLLENLSKKSKNFPKVLLDLI